MPRYKPQPRRTVLEFAVQNGLAGRGTCTWTLDDPEMDAWATACGQMFIITCDTPGDHKMNYCCYCGGELVEGEPCP